MSHSNERGGSFPPQVGDFVVFRHNSPWGEEPHQLPAMVLDVTPGRKGVDVKLQTREGLFLVKGINKKNFSLCFQP